MQHTMIPSSSTKTEMSQLSRGLSNAYLDRLGKKLFQNFLGVFPCDIHPINVHKNSFSIIFNTGDSSTTGEHFVAIVKISKSIFYFDSFGKHPSDPNILKFINKIKKKNRRLIVWKKKIQDDSSSFCGFYCIGFIIHKHIKNSTFLRLTKTKSFYENDNKIIDYIVNNIHKCK